MNKVTIKKSIKEVGTFPCIYKCPSLIEHTNFNFTQKVNFNCDNIKLDLLSIRYILNSFFVKVEWKSISDKVKETIIKNGMFHFSSSIVNAEEFINSSEIESVLLMAIKEIALPNTEKTVLQFDYHNSYIMIRDYPIQDYVFEDVAEQLHDGKAKELIEGHKIIPLNLSEDCIEVLRSYFTIDNF